MFGLWDSADELVQQGAYVKAARTYYQVFRCGTATPLDPRVFDAGQLGPFDSALRQAAAGNFVTAVSGLREIIAKLPEFGEARFLMGIFQWSAGMHTQARDTWQATITAPYFTQPPDSSQVPYVAGEAKKFLTWSSTRS